MEDNSRCSRIQVLFPAFPRMLGISGGDRSVGGSIGVGEDMVNNGVATGDVSEAVGGNRRNSDHQSGKLIALVRV